MAAFRSIRPARTRLLHLKVLALATVISVGSTARATPLDVSYDLRISENLQVLKNPNDMHAQMMAAWTTPSALAMERNRPYLLLENTSSDPNAELTSFSMTIGDTSQTFDWARIVSMSPGVSLAANIIPDTSDNHLKGDVITLSFTGLTPGKEVIFHIDIDPKMATANPFTDYRKVLFDMPAFGQPPNTNNSGNSKSTATFHDPTLSPSDLVTPQIPWNNPETTEPTVFGMTFVSHYMNDHVTSYQIGNVVPLPEPASLTLAAVGITALLWGRRRFGQALTGR